VSSNNSGYAELQMNGAAIAQSWGGNANGYHCMLYFNEVIELDDNTPTNIMVKNVNLSHSFNMGQPTATNLSVVKLA